MITAIGYIGAACLTIAPFYINYKWGKIAAAIGLALLTVQAIDAALWNLVILNLAGIVGYTRSIYK